MSLASWVRSPGPNGFGYGSTAEEVSEGLDLAGKTYLLTGCNSGIGRETLRVLGLRGARVVALARTRDKASHALGQTNTKGTPIACDLSEPASVKAVAVDEALDGIICNAGIMALPELQVKHGVELQFLTNHLGHFWLVNQLLPWLKPTGRVVMVSSNAHRYAPPDGIDFDNLAGERRYTPWMAYGRSKLANILMARALAQRFEGTAQTAHSLHPGVIETNLGRHSRAALPRLARALAKPVFFKTPAQGAATQVFCATHPAVGKTNGLYWSHCAVAQPRARANRPGVADKLWEWSEQAV